MNFKEMNLPNKLTMIRVAMIPFFLVFELAFYGHAWAKWIAFVIFVAASLTDKADGYIARKYNLVTNFGKFMDPLADKLLVCSALICFVSNGQIPAWIVIVIVAREFIISGFRLIAVESGKVIAAGNWGKAKTVVQMIMVIVLIADLPIPGFNIIETILVYAALILTVISLLDYLLNNKEVLQG